MTLSKQNRIDTITKENNRKGGKKWKEQSIIRFRDSDTRQKVKKMQGFNS